MKLSFLALLDAALVLGVGAVGFLGPEHGTALTQTLAHGKKEMPVTNHDKKAGDGYQKGSPLFEKQQAREAGGTVPPPPAQPIPAPLDAKADSNGVKITGRKIKIADFDQYWASVGGWEGHLWVSLAVFLHIVVTWTIIALIWEKGLKGRNPDMQESERKRNNEGFAYGLFSMEHCFGSHVYGHHTNLCICSAFCAPLRMADTYSKKPLPVRIGGFWAALFLILVLHGMDFLTFGFTGFILFGVVVYYRQKMREQYGMPTGGATWMYDCCTWFWCPCCAIAQEARQVEFVEKLGADRAQFAKS